VTQRPPARAHLGYRPALDGLARGGHSARVPHHTGALLVPSWQHRLFPGGFLGVNVFFVLSGFLITDAAARAPRDRAHPVRTFYARRILRLFPAVIALVLVVFAYAVITDNDVANAARAIAVVGTYTANWAALDGINYSHYVGHLWSLAIEEQFYLAWPLLLFAAMRLHCSRRQMLWIVLGAAALAASWRATLWEPGAWLRIYIRTDAQADSLLIGAALALLPAGRLSAAVPARARGPLAWLVLAAVVGAAETLEPSSAVLYPRRVHRPRAAGRAPDLPGAGTGRRPVSRADEATGARSRPPLLLPVSVALPRLPRGRGANRRLVGSAAGCHWPGPSRWARRPRRIAWSSALRCGSKTAWVRDAAPRASRPASRGRRRRAPDRPPQPCTTVATAMDLEAYQEHYVHEEGHWWFRGRMRVIWALLGRVDLPERPRVLDAGCGTGRNLVEFGRLGPAHGVDASETAVEFCRRRGLDGVRLGRLEALPFDDASFDLLLACDVLEHVPDDAPALAELRRVAAPGARLLIHRARLPLAVEQARRPAAIITGATRCAACASTFAQPAGSRWSTRTS